MDPDGEVVPRGAHCDPQAQRGRQVLEGDAQVRRPTAVADCQNADRVLTAVVEVDHQSVASVRSRLKV